MEGIFHSNHITHLFDSVIPSDLEKQFFNLISEELKSTKITGLEIYLKEIPVATGFLSNAKLKGLAIKNNGISKKLEIVFRVYIDGDAALFTRYDVMEKGFFDNLNNLNSEQIFYKMQTGFGLIGIEKFRILNDALAIIFEKVVKQLTSK